MKAKISIKEVEFDDIHYGDFIVLENYMFGDFNNFEIGEVYSKSKTFLHNHRYIFVDGQRFYKSEYPKLKKVIIEKVKRK